MMSIKNRGFTLIEGMIVVVIACILLAVAMPAITKKSNGLDVVKPGMIPSTVTHDDQTKCNGGFKFYNDKQIIGTNGGGVSC